VEYKTDYYWVVLCKNHRFHHKGNIAYEHHILLGVTDAFASLPILPEKIKVRCDSCGEEYSYKETDMLRDEAQIPESFNAHPLFNTTAREKQFQIPNTSQALGAKRLVHFLQQIRTILGLSQGHGEHHR